MSLTQRTNDEHWESALEYIEAIEKAHDATVWVRIERDGTNYAKTCYVRVVACVPVFEGAGRTKRVEAYEKWPRAAHPNVGALVYYLCHLVDQEISRTLYKQLELPS